MPIQFTCKCGQTLEMEEIYAGQEVECSICNALVVVPSKNRAKPISKRPADSQQTPKEEPNESPKGSFKVADDDEKPRRRREREYDEDDEKPRRRREREYDEDDERPRKRKQADNGGGFFSTEKSILNAGVLGGLLAMIGAVAWFVLGFMLGWVFYYPPILFILGLISFVKGLFGNND
jgi:hypothetical protein